MTFLRFLSVIALMTLAGTVSAQQLAEQEHTYCQFVEGVARSESALLMSPQVFVAGGKFITSGDPEVVPAEQRVLAGVDFNFADVAHGIAVRRHAEADCTRNRAIVRLEAFLDSALASNENMATISALRAQAAVLESALPRGSQIVQETKTAMEQNIATLAELTATQMRLDSMQELFERTNQDMDQVAGRELILGSSVAELMRARDSSDLAEERFEAKIRQTQAWNLTLHAGYDHIFGPVRNSSTPLFASGSLSFNLGGLFQRRADAQAFDARRRLATTTPGGIDERLEQLVQKFRAILKGDQARLHEATILLADIEERMKTVEAAGNNRAARAFADYFWFDLIKARAEHEYLRVHVEDLSRILGQMSTIGADD